MAEHKKAFVIVMLLILVPSLYMSLNGARNIETDRTYLTLKNIDSLFDKNSIVFIDKDIKSVPVHLIAPLRFTFNEKVFMFREEDFLSGKLDKIFKFFLEEGRKLYIISNNGGLENRYFSHKQRMPISLGFDVGLNLEASIYEQAPEIMELVADGK